MPVSPLLTRLSRMVAQTTNTGTHVAILLIAANESHTEASPAVIRYSNAYVYEADVV